MITPQEISFRKAISHLTQDDRRIITTALRFAKLHHEGQYRLSGESYIIHPIAVALKLFLKYQDVDLTCSALLHDVLEDCKEVSRTDIYNLFGDEIGFLVESVTKTYTDFYNEDSFSYVGKLERLIWAGTKDIRVFILKIADREDNLWTLDTLKAYAQVRMAFETQAIYHPLKNILEYDLGLPLIEATKKYSEFVWGHRFRSITEIKEFLISFTFNNIDNATYNLVYNDSPLIIWNIEDLNMYAGLCANPKLAPFIKFKRIVLDDGAFQASFMFVKGVVLEQNAKFSILSFKTDNICLK